MPATMTAVAQDLAAFQALKRLHHVTEGYGVSVVAIGCEHCAVIYERDRHDGRRITIADRREAVRHLRDVHGIDASGLVLPEDHRYGV